MMPQISPEARRADIFVPIVHVGPTGLQRNFNRAVAIKMSSLAALRSLLAVALLILFAVPKAHPQTSGPERTKVLDLVFRVEDMGGKIQDLEVKELGNEIHIELAADVLFDFDKADIRPSAQSTLHQAAEIIRQHAKSTVRIEGHTDSKGNDAYNQKLSERRANSVKTWLTNKEGLGNVPFVTQGFGAKKPVAPNKKPDGSDDPEGRQKNRRVEIVLKK